MTRPSTSKRPDQRKPITGSLLNRQVSTPLALKDVDLDCIELIALHGPISPTALAQRAGLRPATVTGILDRLQRGGWVTRERDPAASDRRAVEVRAVPDRGRDLFRCYSAMNARLDTTCAGYTQAELDLLVDFLDRVITAGRDATDELAGRRHDTRRCGNA